MTTNYRQTGNPKVTSNPRVSSNKNICVSMNLDEQVLDSYLLRVFSAELVTKKSVKTVRFPEANVKTNGWSIKQFKNFCDMCVHDKNKLRLYKAKIVKKEINETN